MSAPTLQSIAEACDTNRMSVSLALRGRPGVSAALRARVLAEAERQGYRPNPLVSALMARLRAGRSPRYQATLALVHAAPTPDWREMFAACRGFDAGLRARCKQLGYGLETVWLRSPKWRRGGVERALLNRGIHGLVVAPLPDGSSRVEFDFAPFAAAAIGQSLHRPTLHAAAPHYFETIALPFGHLRAAGRQRIGFALPPELDERSRHQWLGAFLACQAAARGAAGAVPPLVSPTDEAGLLAWVRRERADALISADAGHVRVLRRAGLHVPEQVAYVCFIHSGEPGDVAGASNHPTEIAAAAVDMVVAQLHRNERGVPERPRLLQISPRWVPGPTMPG